MTKDLLQFIMNSNGLEDMRVYLSVNGNQKTLYRFTDTNTTFKFADGGKCTLVNDCIPSTIHMEQSKLIEMIDNNEAEIMLTYKGKMC